MSCGNTWEQISNGHETLTRTFPFLHRLDGIARLVHLPEFHQAMETCMGSPTLLAPYHPSADRHDSGFLYLRASSTSHEPTKFVSHRLFVDHQHSFFCGFNIRHNCLLLFAFFL